MRCENCGFTFGGDRQMIILIPSQIARCPQCGKLMWRVEDGSGEVDSAACELEQDESGEPD
jgi:predicted Zn-ribbon and HTH transcriptional regulator